MELGGLTSADDTLHVPSDDDPWWTETVWFPFFVPEHRLFGNYYLWFRPNLGICGGGLRLFDDTAVLPWDVPFNLYHRALPLRPDLDLRDAQVGDGIWLRALEPATSYAFGLDHPRCTLDVRWDAVSDPLIRRPSPTPPFRGGHHIDQIGHITGTLELDGATFTVDCLAPRDRSWGPRSDHKGVKAAYDWAFASPDEGFLVLSMDRAADDADDRVVQGMLIRGGTMAKVVDGRRVARRRADGLPESFALTFTDALGRTVSASGRSVAVSTELVQRPMLLHQSLTDWQWDGHRAWGEDEDVWDPELWRTRGTRGLPA